MRVTSIGLVKNEGGYLWTDDPEVVGINTMTLGMWAEVLNRWVGPAAKVIAVAKTHKTQRTTRDGKSVPSVVPDSLAVAAELKCGATATYHLSTCATGGPGHSIEIYGTRGAPIYRLFKEEILGASGVTQKWQHIVIPPEDERFHSTDAEFIQAIREKGIVSPDFEEGLRYMGFCEAVALSAKTQRAIRVPPPVAVMVSWDQAIMGSE